MNSIVKIIKDKIKCYIWKYKEDFDRLKKRCPSGDQPDDIIRYYKQDNLKWSSFGLYWRIDNVCFIWEKPAREKDKYILAYALYRYIEYSRKLLKLWKLIKLYIFYWVYIDDSYDLEVFNPAPNLSYTICDKLEECWKKIYLPWTKICKDDNKYINYYKSLLKELELEEYFCVRWVYDEEEKEYTIVIDLKEDYKNKVSTCKADIELYQY